MTSVIVCGIKDIECRNSECLNGCVMEGENKERIISVIQEIRKSDCGAWLKDCHTVLFSCGDGREKRMELARLLSKLYQVSGV